MEKLFLQAVAAEVDRTGIEEVAFDQVYRQLESLAVLHGISKPPRMSKAIYIPTSSCFSFWLNGER